jgi:hypothetical protein
MIYPEATTINRKVIDALVDHHYDLKPTGSRWVCPESASPASDYDLFAMTNPFDVLALIEIDGWRIEGSMDIDVPVGNFVSLRKHNVNFIACLNKSFFELFERATAVCHKIGGPIDRVGRIAVFRAILYGEKPE